MTVVFIRLKLRLLRNVLRTSGGPGLVIFTVLAVGVGVVVARALSWATDLERFIVTPIIGALFVVSWALGPVLFGNSDETIDTTRLALFPLDPNRLAGGLTVQALVGPGPMAALIALGGAASQSPTVPSAVLAALACIATVALATTLSRVLLTALGSGLRRRRSRDLATLATGLAIGLGAVTLQLFAVYGDAVDLASLARIADVVRLTPFGWPSDALGRASTGALLVPTVELVGTAALIVVAVRAWAVLLARALTEVSEHDDQTSTIRPLVSVAGGGPVSALRATFVKERRYFSRHPRYRVQVMSQATVLIFASIVLFGMTVGNLLMMQPLLIAERFGVRDYSTIYGRSQAVTIVGVAGGPLLIGWLFDVFGSYEVPYAVASALCLAGAVILSQAGPATQTASPPTNLLLRLCSPAPFLVQGSWR